MIPAIAVVNHSTLIHDPDRNIGLMVKAIAIQLSHDYAQAWGQVPPSLGYYPAGAVVPSYCSIIAIFDDADQSGALGWHAEAPDGNPYGRVFVGPILANGGSFLNGSLSVSATLSHEVLEMAGDPFINLWADGPDGTQYCIELGDPVESDAYEIDVSGIAVSVSNFVWPAFFNGYAPAGSRLDQMSTLDTPFQTGHGGYQIIRKDGEVSQVDGAERMLWKAASKMHPAARSQRRYAIVTK